MTRRSLSGHGPLVVKIGSSLLLDRSGTGPRAHWMAGLAADLLALGRPLVLVSSGAVALGRRRLDASGGLALAQARAAKGQIALAQAWDAALGGRAAQILLSLADLEDRRRYLNARDTVETLLAHGLVPVVNENDTVATEELRFGDNDRLAARMAGLTGAGLLVLLSDVDGLMTADPAADPEARLIAEVERIDESVLALAGPAKRQGVGTGGMISKLIAAQLATRAGAEVWLLNGRPDRPLSRYLAGGPGTRFLSSTTALAVRKAWLAGLQTPRGTLRLDAGAVAALVQGRSLLTVGLTGLDGSFDRGDLVRLAGPDGGLLGQGLAAYDAGETRALIGRSSTEAEAVLGYAGRGPVVHRDDLVLFADQGDKHAGRSDAPGC